MFFFCKRSDRHIRLVWSNCGRGFASNSARNAPLQPNMKTREHHPRLSERLAQLAKGLTLRHRRNMQD